MITEKRQEEFYQAYKKTSQEISEAMMSKTVDDYYTIRIKELTLKGNTLLGDELN